MGRYNDAAGGRRKAAEEPVEAAGLGCTAHGCPLAGALSESTRGGGPWFCRYHFREQPKDWDRITKTLREQLRERTFEANPGPSPAVIEMRQRILAAGKYPPRSRRWTPQQLGEDTTPEPQ